MTVEWKKFLGLKDSTSTSILPKPFPLFLCLVAITAVVGEACSHLMDFIQPEKIINEVVYRFCTGFWSRLDSRP
ncbi:hypothetical protein C3E98_035840, partial [Pseudomonas sp. MWU13-2625]